MLARQAHVDFWWAFPMKWGGGLWAYQGKRRGESRYTPIPNSSQRVLFEHALHVQPKRGR